MVTRSAVILAAGVGSRLGPITEGLPKVLVPLLHETLLERAVRLLADHGVLRLVVVTGYREEQVRAALANAPLEVQFCPNRDFASTQNAASLALAEDALAGQAFFKLDGDLVFVPEVLVRLDAARADLAVAVDARAGLDAEAMKVRVGDGARILEFGKRLDAKTAYGESIGIERVSADVSRVLFRALSRDEARAHYYEDVYSSLIREGALSASAVDVGDLPWAEVDTPSDLARARDLVSVFDAVRG